MRVSCGRSEQQHRTILCYEDYSQLCTKLFADSSLAAYCGFSDYTKLYSRDSTEKDCAPEPKLDIQKLKLPDIESELLVKHVGMIAELEKKLGDDPEFACCSCKRLLQRKSVTAFKFSEST